MAAVIYAGNFAQYERDTETESKVRRAGAWIDDVISAHQRQAEGQKHASMTSTKMRRFVEFRPGEVTVWAGYSGHRKSMFTSQVALDLCRQRERVLVASFEMLPTQTLDRMAQQAAAMARPDARWMKAFGAWTDNRLWLFDHVGRIKPDLCLKLGRYFADELGGSQVFIDSMMMVCESEERLDEQKQFATDLCRIAQETGLHIHVIAHCRKPQNGSEDKPPTKYDVRGASAITDQAANVITVWENKAKRQKLEIDPHDQAEQEKPDALITVEKQRNGSWEGRMQMWFDPTCLRFCDDRMAVIHNKPIEFGGDGVTS